MPFALLICWEICGCDSQGGREEKLNISLFPGVSWVMIRSGPGVERTGVMHGISAIRAVAAGAAWEAGEGLIPSTRTCSSSSVPEGQGSLPAEQRKTGPTKA